MTSTTSSSLSLSSEYSSSSSSSEASPILTCYQHPYPIPNALDGKDSPR